MSGKGDLEFNMIQEMVGPTGFEPATSTAPWWHATGLRYGPKKNIKLFF